MRNLLIVWALSLSACSVTDITSFISGSRERGSPSVDADDCAKAGAQADAPFANSSSGATGVPGDEFIICTSTQFAAIGADSTFWSSSFRLASDLDMGGVAVISIGDTGQPFDGVFVGNRFSINSININNSGGNSVGVFGVFGVIGASGIVEGLRIINSSVLGLSDVGVFVGENQGFISRCSVEGSSILVDSGSMVNIGGFVGENFGSIQDSYVSGVFVDASVAGSTETGGFVGKHQSGGQILNSYVEGAVTGITTVGGFAGDAQSGSNIDNCFLSVDVSGTTAIALDVGSGAGIGTNFFRDSSRSCSGSPCTTTLAAVAATTVDLQDSSSIEHQTLSWDFAGTWSEVSGSFPELQ